MNNNLVLEFWLKTFSKWEPGHHTYFFVGVVYKSCQIRYDPCKRLDQSFSLIIDELKTQLNISIPLICILINTVNQYLIDWRTIPHVSLNKYFANLFRRSIKLKMELGNVSEPENPPPRGVLRLTPKTTDVRYT